MHFKEKTGYWIPDTTVMRRFAHCSLPLPVLKKSNMATTKKRKGAKPINALPDNIIPPPSGNMRDLRPRRKKPSLERKEEDKRADIPEVERTYVPLDIYEEVSHEQMCLDVTGSRFLYGTPEWRRALFLKFKSEWRGRCERCKDCKTEWDLDGLTMHYFQCHSRRRVAGTYEFCPFCQCTFKAYLPGDPLQGDEEEMHLCPQRRECYATWNSQVHTADYLLMLHDQFT